MSRDIVIGVCRALSGTGSIGVDVTADTDKSVDRLGLPLLPRVLLNLSASLRAQHDPARPTT